MAAMDTAESGGMPEGYIPPNVTPKCTWALGKDQSESPHHHLPRQYVLLCCC